MFCSGLARFVWEIFSTLTAVLPRERDVGIRWIGWVGHRADLDAAVERKIFSPTGNRTRLSNI
jgi:hypothetical protein